MSAQHTPGPWQVGPVDDTVITHAGEGGVRYEIAAVDGDYNEPDKWPVMEANARLIAAAPDLLAALRDAIGALEFSRDYHSDLSNAEQAMCQDKLDAALAAIAKATGAA